MSETPRPEDLFDIWHFHSSTRLLRRVRAPRSPRGVAGGDLRISPVSIGNRNSRVENPTNQQIKLANKLQGGAYPAHTAVSLLGHFPRRMQR